MANELKPAKERLQKVLEATGHAAKRSLGQNFLVSDAIIRKILQAAFDTRPTTLIEVGPGPGALTEGLRRIGAPMTLIELDTGLAEYWRSQGMTVVEADALQLNWAPLIPDGRTVLVSNLPYQISSSLVIERSIAGRVMMVTGAGGSIGAEMCRQIARFRPARLLLVEQAEQHLFEIDRELERSFPGVPRVPHLADITDKDRKSVV